MKRKISYALGTFAALPEWSPRAFYVCLPYVRKLARLAPDSGAYGDGYDAMADYAAGSR